MIYRLLRNSEGSSDLNVSGENLPMEFNYSSQHAVELWRVMFNIIDNQIKPTSFGGIHAQGRMEACGDCS